MAYEGRARTDGRLVSEARTVQVQYDYAARRAVPIPDALSAVRAGPGRVRRAATALLLLASAIGAACSAARAGSCAIRREVHLRNLRQLTFGGRTPKGTGRPTARIIFQSTSGGLPCDQIFVMDRDGGNKHRVSNGQGKCTCSYFFPDGKRILYASTFGASPECPAKPDYSKGYVWKLEPDYEIFTALSDGSDVRQITHHPGYDAEATISPDGRTIVFTSLRDGDIDLYTMKPDGTDLRRITHELGYDGGAFFSRDGKRIVWRASRPRTEEEVAAYAELLHESQIRPMELELFVADADGTHARQVTTNGASNFAPYFFPDGRRIIYASNVAAPGSRNFDLWIVKEDGTGLEQVTFSPEFDGFPMFSPDGKHLVFASNRNGKTKGETNLFLADWVD
jgi:Tol biopolymer transport system component